MRVAHRHDDRRMPQEFLHRHDVHPASCKARGERVPEGMPSDALEACTRASVLESELDILEVVASDLIEKYKPSALHPVPCLEHACRPFIERQLQRTAGLSHNHF